MNQQNTIPAPLGSISGPETTAGLLTQQSNAAETPLAMKLVFWVAVGLLAFGAVKYFAH